MADSSDGGCSCIGLIILGAIIWAVLFGVTVDGKHYGLDCSQEKGIEFNTPRERGIDGAAD